jgi:hypothetical protein
MKRNLLSLLFIVMTLALTAQTNLAVNATPSASASSSGSYGPSNWNDGNIGPNYYFGWLGTDNTFPQPAWLKYEWNSSVTLNKLVFHPPTWASGGGVPFNGNVDLQYWDGSAWQTHANYSTSNGTSADTFSFTSVSTTKIRLTNFTCYGGQNPGWDEIEAYYFAPPSHDVGVSSFDNKMVSANTQTKFRIWVRNYSTNTPVSNIPVKCKLGSTTNYTGMVNGPIQPGDSVMYTFSSFYTIPVAQFEAKAWTELSSDVDLTNDTSTYFFVVPATNYFDAEITQLSSPDPADLVLNQTDEVIIEVMNNSSEVIYKIPVKYYFESTMDTASFVDTITGPIYPNNSVSFTFSTDLQLNINAANDTINGVVYIDWDDLDLNNDTASWNHSFVSVPSFEEKDPIHITPNPAVNVCSIHLPDNDFRMIRVYNLSGQMILSRQVDYPVINMDISDFAPGLYLLEIRDKAGNRSVRKLIKQ